MTDEAELRAGTTRPSIPFAKHHPACPVCGGPTVHSRDRLVCASMQCGVPRPPDEPGPPAAAAPPPMVSDGNEVWRACSDAHDALSIAIRVERGRLVALRNGLADAAAALESISDPRAFTDAQSMSAYAAMHAEASRALIKELAVLPCDRRPADTETMYFVAVETADPPKRIYGVGSTYREAAQQGRDSGATYRVLRATPRLVEALASGELPPWTARLDGCSDMTADLAT